MNWGSMLDPWFPHYHYCPDHYLSTAPGGTEVVGSVPGDDLGRQPNHDPTDKIRVPQFLVGIDREPIFIDPRACSFENFDQGASRSTIPVCEFTA